MALLARQSRARLGCLKQQVLTTTVRGMSTKPDKTLHLVRAAGMPILQQLRLEEALLRNDDRNWCVLLCCARRGGSYWLVCSHASWLQVHSELWQLAPADRDGLEWQACKAARHGSLRKVCPVISTRRLAWLTLPCPARDRIPIIKRYSGGGTVVVDQSTLYASLIMNEVALLGLPYYMYTSSSRPVCCVQAAAGVPAFPRDIMTWSADCVYKPVFDGTLGVKVVPASLHCAWRVPHAVCSHSLGFR